MAEQALTAEQVLEAVRHYEEHVGRRLDRDFGSDSLASTGAPERHEWGLIRALAGVVADLDARVQALEAGADKAPA